MTDATDPATREELARLGKVLMDTTTDLITGNSRQDSAMRYASGVTGIAAIITALREVLGDVDATDALARGVLQSCLFGSEADLMERLASVTATRH